MTRPPAIRAVLFDLGGVWLRLRSWPEACAHVADEHPGAADPAGLLRRMDDHPQVAEAHLAYESGRLDTDAFMRRTAQVLDATPAAVQAVFCARIQGPYPGTDTLLDRLAASGVTTGCLSNTNALHWAHMQGAFGDRAPQRIPLERLHHRFASQEMGCVKPDAAIYVAVERRLRLPGGRIAFFDDRHDNIDAALARGWRAHRIDPHGDTSPAEQITAHLTAMEVLP